MKFWDTNHGKWIGHTIHDHNNSVGFIKRALEHIEYKEYDIETIEKYFPLILEQLKKGQDAVDYTYIKLKEEYEESIREL